jgi:hypothetical protein
VLTDGRAISSERSRAHEMIRSRSSLLASSPSLSSIAEQSEQGDQLQQSQSGVIQAQQVPTVPLQTRAASGTAKLLWKALLLVSIIGIFVYMVIIWSSPSTLQEHRKSSLTSKEQLTLVINTFKRPDIMEGAMTGFHLAGLDSL